MGSIGQRSEPWEEDTLALGTGVSWRPPHIEKLLLPHSRWREEQEVLSLLGVRVWSESLANRRASALCPDSTLYTPQDCDFEIEASLSC